jgi:hypothetical protein
MEAPLTESTKRLLAQLILREMITPMAVDAVDVERLFTHINCE